eukprot:1289265-Pleurochrysis_carterae.AAC.1
MHDASSDGESIEGTRVEDAAPAAAETNRKASAYGASMFNSASRMWDEQESRRSAAINRTKRPTH